MVNPSDEQIRRKIKKVVKMVDIEVTGLKSFMQLLSKEMGDVDLKSRKSFIKDALTEVMREMRNDNQHDGHDSEQEHSSHGEEEDDNEKPTISSKRKSLSGGPRGGLTVHKEISEKLAAFLRKGKYMARTEVVQELWAYIRENELQNPENKREILLDDAMKDVFGCRSFTIFTMNKYIGAHIEPFKPVDLTLNSATANKRKASRSMAHVKKKRKVGTQPPYRLSEALAEVVGKPILPRPQVVSEIWNYIRANDLQNPSNKREILCDKKLKAVMKQDKVSMFKMNQLIGAHLLEKLDRSEYQHDDGDGDED